MTKENHQILEGLRPEAKEAYISAKAQILKALKDMDLLQDTSLAKEEKETIYKLLDETTFMMKSKEI